MTADPWFDTFLADSQGMHEPVLHRGLYKEPICTLDDVAEVLRNMCSTPPKSLLLRIYRDGGARSDMAAQVIAHPPKPGEPFTDWWRHTFPPGCALVLNGGERFCTALARRVAERLLLPLYRQIGIPWGGVDLAFFIGDYDQTPFGVHADPDPAFIIPIGQVQRSLSMWSPEAFHRVAGTREVSFALETLRPSRRQFTLGEGDQLFLPARYYHIGENTGLSASLTISLGEVTARGLTRKVFGALMDRHLPGPAQNLRFDLEAADGPLPIEAAVERWVLPDAQTVAEWLHGGFEDFRLSLLSNAGFRLSPVLGPHTPEALAGQVVTRVAPFTIRHRWIDGDRMVLFVRNASVTIRAHRKLPAVLAQLDEGEALSVDGIVTALQPRFREDATLHVLNLLRNLGGIEIVPRARVEAA